MTKQEFKEATRELEHERFMLDARVSQTPDNDWGPVVFGLVILALDLVFG